MFCLLYLSNLVWSVQQPRTLWLILPGGLPALRARCLEQDVRVGLRRRLSAEELMLLNCGVGEDS